MTRTTPAAERRALSVDEFAKRWGIGRNAVYDAIGRGELDTIKIGKRRLITLEQEEAFRQRMESAA
jgi:excisionase family DNA binding protein